MAASSSRQYDSPSTVSGASKYLGNFPSQGYSSSSTFVSSNSGGMGVYICDHVTTPPEGSSSKVLSKDLQSSTVERLRALLKERSLSF